ncbi:hypothetical protein WMY93_033822 [Mugilogobius chulae]|uniref:Uncharacterized protein n=1 Tax=Mugilogobius chulae TaxID=88201 RepID=A0AAW0MHR4_9GOBI
MLRADPTTCSSTVRLQQLSPLSPLQSAPQGCVALRSSRGADAKNMSLETELRWIPAERMRRIWEQNGATRPPVCELLLLPKRERDGPEAGSPPGASAGPSRRTSSVLRPCAAPDAAAPPLRESNLNFETI